ncbi:Ring finger domain/Zinc finger, C3HC4 type (RING finger)/RING-H2 zinc finger domain containing protein, putative [Angomonas deanei]|uniref:RING-type E3 ubiquitin transferase n=1 Tax=Angomonas deanei TaxID=59799 RepID=A0A7G2CNX1_9TRYP|nr:Ring finger domain/Zinc finger, C3HC4 type (RING finger)/RING-H2 zinc finger domain containing protein, putative [Angomonas deanei]
MSDMPKRERDESKSSPSTQPASPAHENSNPELERVLADLDIDEDFKTSIRAMSPETRRDIINDIIRNRQLDTADRLIPEDLPAGDDEPRVRLVFRTTEDEEDEEGEEHAIEHPLSQLLPLLLLLRRQDGPGAIDSALQNHITGMLQQLSQMHAMQNMGIDRDIDDMSYEELLELEERMGSVSKGLPEAKIPEYLKGANPPQEGTCAVCLSEWTTADTSETCCQLSPCRHVFHKDCIKQWLLANKQCPLCKQEVVKAAI